MSSQIVYFDETGDDGITTASSEAFILTSLYMPMKFWQENYNKIKVLRRQLRDEYGFYVKEEMHTKHFLADIDPYRKYGWSLDNRRKILLKYVETLQNLNASIINVIIDKTKIYNNDYRVLECALKYNIQRIENDSNYNGEWNYLIIIDKGRLAPMRRTARQIRSYNLIPSMYQSSSVNQPIQNLVEDIMEKDSRESYFIQVCDFVSYFVHMYYKTNTRGNKLPNRVGCLIDEEFVEHVLDELKSGGLLNLRANSSNKYGFVIYPK